MTLWLHLLFFLVIYRLFITGFWKFFKSISRDGASIKGPCILCFFLCHLIYCRSDSTFCTCRVSSFLPSAARRVARCPNSLVVLRQATLINNRIISGLQYLCCTSIGMPIITTSGRQKRSVIEYKRLHKLPPMFWGRWSSGYKYWLYKVRQVNFRHFIYFILVHTRFFILSTAQNIKVSLAPVCEKRNTTT